MTLLFEVECLVCKTTIDTNSPYRLYCCNACRQAAYRAKAHTPRKAPVHHVRNSTLPKQTAAEGRRRRLAQATTARQAAARDRRRKTKHRTKPKPPQDPRTKRKPNKRPRRRTR